MRLQPIAKTGNVFAFFVVNRKFLEVSSLPVILNTQKVFESRGKA